MARTRPPLKSERLGFALPAVLSVIGVVTLIFLVALTALNGLTQEARQARERVHFLQAALSTEAQIGFMMATEPVSSGGIVSGRTPRDFESAPINEPLGDLSLVRIDGQIYSNGSLSRPVTVSLQDQAGTVNLNGLNSEILRRLLTRLGIAPNHFPTFEARLNDYRDSDDLESLSGAELQAYGARGLANRPLRHPDEFMSVLGFRDEISPRAWRAVRQHLSADGQQGSFNVNSATPEALKMVLGIDDARAKALVEARERAPFLSTDEIDAVIGPIVLWNEDSFYTFPYPALYVTVYDKETQWYYRSRLTLTPSALERPLWVDQTDITEMPKRAKPDVTHAQRLPYAPY